VAVENLVAVGHLVAVVVIVAIGVGRPAQEGSSYTGWEPVPACQDVEDVPEEARSRLPNISEWRWHV
jgi:hypothetical protein